MNYKITYIQKWFCLKSQTTHKSRKIINLVALCTKSFWLKKTCLGFNYGWVNCFKLGINKHELGKLNLNILKLVFWTILRIKILWCFKIFEIKKTTNKDVQIEFFLRKLLKKVLKCRYLKWVCILHFEI